MLCKGCLSGLFETCSSDSLTDSSPIVVVTKGVGHHFSLYSLVSRSSSAGVIVRSFITKVGQLVSSGQIWWTCRCVCVCFFRSSWVKTIGFLVVRIPPKWFSFSVGPGGSQLLLLGWIESQDPFFLPNQKGKIIRASTFVMMMMSWWWSRSVVCDLVVTERHRENRRNCLIYQRLGRMAEHFPPSLDVVVNVTPSQTFFFNPKKKGKK